jgi:opacity protein-like surface antigen
MIGRILSTCVLALLFCGCVVQVNAAFYLRPEVQFGILADGHSDTDMGVGGALSFGAAFGRKQRFELGGEFSRIKYKGEFDFFSYRGVGMSNPEWKKVSNTCTVTPIQSVFRYTFITESEKLRPYLCLSLGYSWVRFDGMGFVALNSVRCFTGGLGGGVSYRLGRRTAVNLGYRYFYSEPLGNKAYYTVRNNAHVFSISVNQLFGYLRK